MKNLVMRASIWTVLGNSSQQILSFLIFVYLARVLSPADFGLMALAAALIDLMTVFGRFGQVEALVQPGSVEPRRASTSFWLICAVGVGLMLVALGLAGPFADLFGEPQVALLLLMLAPVPLLHNLGQVHEAFLRAAFDYRGIAIRNAGATLISGVASVAVAAAGYGVMALVAQKIVFAISFSLLLWLSWRWRPRIAFDVSEARRLLRTGFDVVIASLMNMLNPRIMDMAVGYFLGVTTLGYLRIAWRLLDLALQLIIQPVSNVAISSLTRLGENRPALAGSLLNHLGTLSLIAIPAFAGVGILAEPAIALAAGHQWSASAPMLTMITLTAAALPLNFLFPPAMLAAGQTGTIRRFAVMQIAFTVVSMLVFARYGIVAVLLAHVTRVYVFMALNATAMGRALDLSPTAFLGRIGPPVISTLAMALAVTWLIQGPLPDVPLLVQIAVAAVFGVAIYAAVLLAGGFIRIWDGYLLNLRDLARGGLDPATEKVTSE